MAALEIVALDTATPQLRAPGTGDTYTAPRAIALAPEALTGTAAVSSLSIAQTWNTTGTPAALSVAITDTASNASSRLFSGTVGGADRAYIRKDGGIVSVANITAHPNGGLQVLDSGTNPDTNRGFLVTNFSSSAVVNLAATWKLGWSSGVASSVLDTGFKRSAAAVIGVTNGTTGGGALEFQEQTAPAAPAANNVRLYAVDNGAGKTQLMALFPTGAAQQVAIEP